MPRHVPPLGALTLIEQHLQVAQMISSILQVEATKLQLTPTTARVLASLDRPVSDSLAAPTAVQICAETGYSKPHVSSALKRLSDRGLITATLAPGRDGRTVPLQLTPEGLDVVKKLNSAMLPAEVAIRNSMRVHGARSHLLHALASSLKKFIESRG